MSDTQALLSELARVKALFQLRTIAAHIGAAPPAPQLSQPHAAQFNEKECPSHRSEI